MFYDQGCFGRVELGDLPEDLRRRLGELPGEWLEYDAASGAIVVRHTEPSTADSLPTITMELVRMISEVPLELQEGIVGGDLYVHTTEGAGQLVRLRVEPGGIIQIQWAHPEFQRALKRPYLGGREIGIDPEVQRLNGEVSFAAEDPDDALARIQDAVESFEGLYPEGELLGSVDPHRGTVTLELLDVNFDAGALVSMLQALARPRSLSGRVELSSFGPGKPEQRLRFLFEDGRVWVQHPLLWPHGPGE